MNPVSGAYFLSGSGELKAIKRIIIIKGCTLASGFLNWTFSSSYKNLIGSQLQLQRELLFECMKFSLLLHILQHDFLHVPFLSEMHMMLMNRTVLPQAHKVVSFPHKPYLSLLEVLWFVLGSIVKTNYRFWNILAQITEKHEGFLFTRESPWVPHVD